MIALSMTGFFLAVSRLVLDIKCLSHEVPQTTVYYVVVSSSLRCSATRMIGLAIRSHHGCGVTVSRQAVTTTLDGKDAAPSGYEQPSPRENSSTHVLDQVVVVGYLG